MLTQYSRLTTDQLYLLFCDAQWKNMTEAQCLSALQELENRVAAREGRPAMRVCIMPSQQERPGLNGYYIDGQRSLFITRRFLSNRKNPIFGVKAGEVINTVLHEGRHAFQHEAVRGNVKNISRATMLRWGISFQDYQAETAEMWKARCTMHSRWKWMRGVLRVHMSWRLPNALRS